MTDAKQDQPKQAVPSKLVLVGVVVGSLALGGTAGSLFVAPQIIAARTATDHETPSGHGGDSHGPAGSGTVLRIDNLIVNPAGSQGTRFLMATVAFEFPDSKTEAGVRQREVQVRDAVISTLERQTLEMLTRPGARDSLKRELAGAIAPLAKEAAWVRVYLPQFVVQ